MLTKPTPTERFWSKVDKTTSTCWLWTACISGGGYGVFKLDRKQYAHRLAYEWLVGPIPEGLQLDHLCRVRHCVNPEHLEPVTTQENIRRGLGSSFNSLKTHCPRGHPYAGDNLYIQPGNGKRKCRTCGRENAHIYRRRRRSLETHPEPVNNDAGDGA